MERGIYRQEKYLAEHPELKLFAAEMPFEYYFDKVLFTGSIDRVLQYRDDPKHFVIHDLKTSAEAYDDKKLTSPRQMWVYVGALKERFGTDIQVDCEYEFPVAEEMRKAGTKGWEKRCETKMRKILDDIFNENWTAHPSPLCFYCAFVTTIRINQKKQKISVHITASGPRRTDRSPFVCRGKELRWIKSSTKNLNSSKHWTMNLPTKSRKRRRSWATTGISKNI